MRRPLRSVHGSRLRRASPQLSDLIRRRLYLVPAEHVPNCDNDGYELHALPSRRVQRHWGDVMRAVSIEFGICFAITQRHRVGIQNCVGVALDIRVTVLVALARADAHHDCVSLSIKLNFGQRDAKPRGIHGDRRPLRAPSPPPTPPCRPAGARPAIPPTARPTTTMPRAM